MKNFYFKYLICLSILFTYSCDTELKENDLKEIKNLSILSDEIKLLDEGVLKINNKFSLNNIVNSFKENVTNQNDFYEEIRSIQKKGFKPLTPVFEKNDNVKIQDFIVSKKSRTESLNIKYGITKKSNDIEEVALDDELISDPVLSSLLNEEREIVVGDSLYKYTETGLYFCKVSNKQKLYEYLNKKNNSLTQKSLNNNLGEVILVAEGVNKFTPAQTKLMMMPEDPEGGGWGGGGSTPIPPANPQLIKQNLDIAYIEKNSIWEKVFGASDKSEDYYSDNRRIQVSFWNQNYFIFSSVGCSARLQKREKTLGISYWEKSYADIIELGINDVQYDYKFNTPVYNHAQYNYNTVFFEFNGLSYTIDGRVVTKIPTNGPRFIFDTGDPEKGLTIFIHHNEYELLNAKKLNEVIDNLAKTFVSNLPSSYDKLILDKKIKDQTLTYNVVKAPSLSNKVTFKTLNVVWNRNDENEITHYFDFNFFFTWKSKYEKPEEYLKGLSGATTYSNVSIDLYGAALHNNQWRGRRLLLSN
ncbi:hypothetical protein ACRASX_16340 (plasmid) [Flavobacterium sp. TMP13]|uniref:hypothetical protein n=1 Tax=Flavobacterium sp. TMP13 TaxID=3425950 RepID=UPI003D77FF8B